MATSFSIPSSPKRNIVTIDTFLGADFTNDPSAVSETQSPNCVNMIRDVPGKIRKCMGYYKFGEMERIGMSRDPINAVHRGRFNGTDIYFVHAGRNLRIGTYDPDLSEGFNFTVAYVNSMKDTKSRSWQFGDKFCILDGEHYIIYDYANNTVGPVKNVSYVPTITIAKSPMGGGTSYEALNLVSNKFCELFSGTAGTTTYQLSFGNITTAEVYVLNSSAVWVQKTLNTDYTVNSNGLVTFSVAPGVSPISGEDNVKIIATRDNTVYSNTIEKCTIDVLYGEGGTKDRVFVSGNPDKPNYDWFSAYNDPTYFPDINYSVVGGSQSAIIGYSVINGLLATHKDNREGTQNIVIREGTTVNNETFFKNKNTLQGEGAISFDAFGYLDDEPLFLTNRGVYAITTQDLTGEKYGQNRSFYLDGKLLKENNLKNAFAYVYNDMYWLFINDKAYILDGLQALHTDKSAPYSTRQYAGFYRTNVPATCAFEINGRLCFGTSLGAFYMFYKDVDDPESYNDAGTRIDAIWETADIDGTLFYKNKTFRHLAVRLKAAIYSSVKIYAQKGGLWNFIDDDDGWQFLTEDTTSARYLMFSRIDFSRLSFSTDTTSKVVPTKIKIKKADKVRFRFQNDAKNEPFSITDFAVEYVQSGNVK